MESTFKWLIIVEGDVEPKLHGPFEDKNIRDLYATTHRKEDPDKNDGIYKLDIEATVIVESTSITFSATPRVSSYSGGFFEE